VPTGLLKPSGRVFHSMYERTGPLISDTDISFFWLRREPFFEKQSASFVTVETAMAARELPGKHARRVIAGRFLPRAGSPPRFDPRPPRSWPTRKRGCASRCGPMLAGTSSPTTTVRGGAPMEPDVGSSSPPAGYAERRRLDGQRVGPRPGNSAGANSVSRSFIPGWRLPVSGSLTRPGGVTHHRLVGTD